MHKENLFRLIRHEDVVLWAGAGLSKYAGYPLGNELKKLIYEQLPAAEQAEIDPVNYDLAGIAEEFVRFRGGSRNELRQLIRDVYGKPPQGSKTHDLLAQIPHFHTIITTNYDQLFELAYQERYNKVVDDKDVALRRKEWTDIIKYHGDADDPDTIVLTDSDYSRRYNEDHGAPLRALVTEKISSNVIVFIGYGYEDLNVRALFDKINSLTKGMRKQAFFIAPNLPDRKIDFLNRAGISFIAATADEFLTELIKNIERHIIRDIEQQKLSPETARRFLNRRNIQPTLSGTQDGFILESISSVDKKPLGGSLILNLPENNTIAAQLDAFILGGQTEEITLSGDQFRSANVLLEGITMHGDGREIQSISFQPLPSVTYQVDLLFPEVDFELLRITVQGYVGQHQSVFKVALRNLQIQLIVTKGDPVFDIKFEYQHLPIYTNLKDELEAYRFIKYMFSGKKLMVQFENGGTFEKSIPTDQKHVDRAESYIHYFENLRRIEKSFHLRFQNFVDVNTSTEHIVNKLIRILDHQPESHEINTPVILHNSQISASLIEQLREIDNKKKAIRFASDADEELTLYGHVIKFTRQLFLIPSVAISNLQDLIDGKTTDIALLSRTGDLYQLLLVPGTEEDQLPNIPTAKPLLS